VNHIGTMLEPLAAHSCSSTAHSHPPSALRVSSVCVASLATMNSWAELERRHSGEDDRITIECQQERSHGQGHNFDGDFDAVDTAPVRQAARTPMTLVGSGGGCVAVLFPAPLVGEV
jgi:hypothetical protein